MACRSFNSPIARNRFCISARMIDPSDGLFSSSLFAPLSSGTVLDRYPRIVSARCSVIYGFGSCSHRGGVMTGRSAPSYHLYRFPIAPSLVCLTSPLSIPRDAPRWRSLEWLFDWFWTLNWWTGDEGLTRCRPWHFCIQSVNGDTLRTT